MAVSTSLDFGSPRFLAAGAFLGLGAALGLFLTPLTSAGDNRTELISSEAFYTLNEALLQFERLNESFVSSVYGKGLTFYLRRSLLDWTAVFVAVLYFLSCFLSLGRLLERNTTNPPR